MGKVQYGSGPMTQASTRAEALGRALTDAGPMCTLLDELAGALVGRRTG